MDRVLQLSSSVPINGANNTQQSEKRSRSSDEQMTDEIMTEEIVEPAKSKVAEELEYLKSKGYCCQKRVEEILGCQTDLEPIGNLAFICEKEFYLRPQWSYVGRKNKGFTALLKFDDFLVCTAKSQNKKGAKIACAENSLCLVAPQIF